MSPRRCARRLARLNVPPARLALKIASAEEWGFSVSFGLLRILRRFVAGMYVRACACTVARTCLRNACGHLCCPMGMTMPMNLTGTRVRAARCHARGSAGALCRHGCRCNCAATCAEWKCRRAAVHGPPCLAYLRRPNPPLRILMPGVRACSRRRACSLAWPLPNENGGG